MNGQNVAEDTTLHRGRRPLGKMYAGAAVLALVCVVGAIGYMAAGWSFADSVFMVVITIFGVGYGEVRPVDTVELRTLTGFVIVAGYGAVIYTVGGFIQLVVDGEINRAFGERRMSKDIDSLEGHTIICGYGRMGQSLAAELTRAGRPFVALDADGEAFERAPLASAPWIVGDATTETVLRRAGIDRAATLATVLSNDAANVFVTVTARSMNSSLQILARADDRSTEDKLRHCGADTVVLPTDIGATKMSQLIVRPSAEELLEQLADTTSDVDLGQIGLEFDEIALRASSPWVNRTLGEVEVRGAHGYLIVGVHRTDGSTIMHPPGDLVLDVDDRVIILGYHDDIPELGTKVVRRTGSYRGIPTEL